MVLTDDGDYISGGTSGGGPIDLEDHQNSISPKLVQTTENGREFEPIVVTRLGGTLPFDTNSTQVGCGETVTSNSGDTNLRLVYGCVCTHSQFKTLQRMRSEPAEIKLVSSAYTGPVTFDELKFDRVTDANGAVIRGEGQSNEPHYTVTLQQKEDKNNSVINQEG